MKIEPNEIKRLHITVFASCSQKESYSSDCYFDCSKLDSIISWRSIWREHFSAINV